MVKVLRTIVPNLSGMTPRPKGEKDFVAMHKVEVVADPMDNNDDVFTGSNVKTFDRSAHRYGVQKDPNDTSDPFAKMKKEEHETDEDFENRCLHEAIVQANEETEQLDEVVNRKIVPGTKHWAASVDHAKKSVKKGDHIDLLYVTHRNVEVKHIAQLARDIGRTPTKSMLNYEKDHKAMGESEQLDELMGKNKLGNVVSHYRNEKNNEKAASNYAAKIKGSEHDDVMYHGIRAQAASEKTKRAQNLISVRDLRSHPSLSSSLAKAKEKAKRFRVEKI